MIVPDSRIPVAQLLQQPVEPSMSVNRKVTVPVGSSADPAWSGTTDAGQNASPGRGR